MALLNFNFHGYDFERGLMLLQDSLATALQRLDEKAASISEDYVTYEEAVQNGEARQGERDEETGTWIWEQGQIYEYEIELIKETKNTLRKTYVIAIYHLWERIIRHWTRTHGNENHDALAQKAKDRGQTIHERMKAISLLNNALKHSSQKSGPQLLKEWPSVFPSEYNRGLEIRKLRAIELQQQGHGDGKVWPDWFDAIILNDDDMDLIFEAVRASGPRANG